jgi:hypothetical protein
MRPQVLVFAGCASLIASTAFSAPHLAPHRAVYDLALENATERSGIRALAGRMVYEFNGSPCDGYTTSYRFVTKIDTAEKSSVNDQQTTTYEDGSGKSFNFVTRSFVDRSLDKELKGIAVAEPSGVKVLIEKPEAENVELGKTQFPTQHLIELINKADEGQTFYETNLFDGSEDAATVMTTTVVVGKPAAIPDADPEKKTLNALATDKVWPVDIAYFDLSKADQETPEYRISFKLHENGVTRDLTMDYGEFSMKGQLVDLKLLPTSSDCKQ